MQDLHIKSTTETTTIWAVNADGKEEPAFVYFPETGEMIPYLDAAVEIVDGTKKDTGDNKGVTIGRTPIPVFSYNEKGEPFKVLYFNPQTNESTFAEGIVLGISSDNRMIIDKVTKKGE